MTSTETIGKFSRLVALPHSVFALPFALAALLLAAERGSLVSTRHYGNMQLLLLVVLAVISARTAAMAFNRLVDARLDGENPRTKNRELPAGVLSRVAVLRLVVVSTALFFLCAALLGTHCLVVAPAVIGVLFLYSYTKRFTNFAHVILGLSLALAPGGAWWVLRPQIEMTPLLMMLGVLLWVAGFDVLYSCQDLEFDRRVGLHSIPARVGIRNAFMISRTLHLFAAFCFVAVGISAGLGQLYFAGLAVIGVFFLGQHLLITPKDLSRINMSFFTMNGLISIGYFIVVCVALRAT